MCRPYVVYGHRLRTYNNVHVGEPHTNRTAVQNPPNIIYTCRLYVVYGRITTCTWLSAFHARVLTSEFNMDPPSISPTDEGGTLQDCLRHRRERERARREQETAEQRKECCRTRRQRDQVRNSAQHSEEMEEQREERLRRRWERDGLGVLLYASKRTKRIGKLDLGDSAQPSRKGWPTRATRTERLDSCNLAQLVKLGEPMRASKIERPSYHATGRGTGYNRH